MQLFRISTFVLRVSSRGRADWLCFIVLPVWADGQISPELTERGSQGGNLDIRGPERSFSVVEISMVIYALSG